MAARESLLIAALAACGGPKLPCERVAAKVQGEIRALIIERCTKDDWPAEGRACVARRSTDFEECVGKLDRAGGAFLSQLADAQKAIRDEREPDDRRAGLDLPAGTTMVDPTKPSLVIEIPVVGDVLVQGKQVSDLDLDRVFADAKRRNAQTQVVLQASKGVAHGRVVAIMERAKQAGLSRLAIGTVQ